MKFASSFLLSGVLACVAAAPACAADKPLPPITQAAQEAFWTGDFAELERQNAYYSQPGRIEPDATSQLDLFRGGLNTVFSNDVGNVEAYLQEVDRLTLQWATEHPKSAFAHVLHARALYAHGWSYRGGSYAKDVPPAAWQDFHAYLRRAAEYLHAHADVALTDSYAHHVLIQIGRGLAWKPEQLIAIADDGLKRNPEDTELIFAVAFSLLPKWHGDARILDSYVNHAVQQTRARFGTSMYARLYSMAAGDQYGFDLFEDSLADWPRMKASFEDLLARFPDSPHRLNRYAYMACVAKDRQTLAVLLERIGDAIHTADWGTNPERGLEGCRRLAAGK